MSSKNGKSLNKDKIFEVQGKVWFGNKVFFSGDITERNKKEDHAQKAFFEKAWKEAKIEKIESLSLLFQKYIPVIEAKIIEIKGQLKKGKTWFSLENESIGGDTKKMFLNKIIEESKHKKIFNEKVREFSNMLIDRIKKQKEDLRNKSKEDQKNTNLGYKIILDNYNLKTSSRLVVGLGAGHVFETSLTLHHIFGIPYIPANALKGVVRMVSFWEIAESENRKTEEEIIDDLQKQLYESEISEDDSENILKHKLLFGTQKFKGLLIFLDAYPEIRENQDIFDLDVMTPHYQGYYTQNKPPGDWENPNPIVFLTVKKGINFCFNILFDEFRAKEILNDNSFPQKAKEILQRWVNNSSCLTNIVEKWIKIALKEFGVGAKTRLGYGIFE